MAMNLKKDERGQAVGEYILVLAVIIGAIIFVMNWMAKKEFLFQRITSPMISYMKYNYKYGHKDALGWDEGAGPKKHIQISQPNSGENFKLFFPTDGS